MAAHLNNKFWEFIEHQLTPTEGSGIGHYVTGASLVPFGLLTCIPAEIEHIFNRGSQGLPKDPMEDFSAVLEDSRLWEQVSDIEERIALGKGNPDYLLGPATCTYQDSGAKNCPNSQWKDWEEKILPEGNRSGSSANFFQLYQTPEGRKEITDRLHRLGANSYRFSIEWSHIEPEEGKFDKEKLQIYIDLCKHLRDEGITPMITLHHFSEPKWFHEKGSFENEDNIKYFLSFCERVFPELTQDYHGKPLVEYFCTINEPTMEVLGRYLFGQFSPGLKMDFTRGGHFLKGALKAHCVVYDKLKAMVPTAKIGIVHAYSPAEAKDPLTAIGNRYFNRILNETPLNFFRTGNFELKIPMQCNIVENDLKPKTDFIGLQFYSRSVISLTGPSSYHEPMTQMPYREDPEGLYEAIIETHRATRKPIIVTENGISTHDETQRARFMLRALYAAQRASEVIGKENLWGNYCWSLCDNFEWAFGMRPQAFGMYSVEEGRISDNPKQGTAPYTRLTQAWRGSLKSKDSKEEE